MNKNIFFFIREENQPIERVRVLITCIFVYHRIETTPMYGMNNQWEE